MDRNDAAMLGHDCRASQNGDDAPSVRDRALVDEEQLRKIVKSIDAVPCAWNVDRKELLFMGSQVVAMFGYPVEAWDDPSFWERHIHPDDLIQTLAAYEAGMRRRQDTVMEYRFATAQGDRVWIRDTSRFAVEADGLRVFGTMVDVTAHKQIEQALAASEGRYRALVETANLIPYAHDVGDNRLTYVGPLAAKLLGCSLEEWNGADLWDRHMHPDDKGRVRTERRCLEDSGMSGQLEYRLIRKDGRCVWVSDVSSVLGQATGHREVCGFLIEITDRREPCRECPRCHGVRRHSLH